MGRIDDALKKAQAARDKKRSNEKSSSDESGSALEKTKPASFAAPVTQKSRPAERPVEQTRALRTPEALKEDASKAAPEGRIERGLKRAEKSRRKVASDLLVVQRDPAGGRTEQFRTIRTNILALEPSPAVIGFVSAGDERSSTLVATNLAGVFAESQSARILVVDANLRHRQVADMVEIDGETKGLADALQGRANDIEVITKSADVPYDVVCAGNATGNPGGLIAGPRLSQLLAAWRKNYDHILVDLPPILTYTDAAVIGHELDSVALVVELGETPRSLVDEALEALNGARIKLCGCILVNGAETEMIRDEAD